MIFVTVGTELPFNRMVRVVDEWAREHGRTDVFAQIGHTEWRPSFIPSTAFLNPPEFNQWFGRATTIIAHAGMGTILSALRYEKPILVMPRRASLGEQRNDHQLATARRLLELDKINVAADEIDLRAQLDKLDQLQARGCTGAYASSALLSAVREFVHHGRVSDLPIPSLPGTPGSTPSPAGPVRA